MRKIFLLLTAVFLLARCSDSNKSEKPEALLSKETMVKVMVDMQIAESKVNKLRVSTDSARHVFSIYEMMIFDELDVTPEQYKESYEYYLTEYDDMKAIHSAVVDTITNRQKQLSK